MRIVLAMTYYRPYVSGPIVYADNLAAELVRRGHEVTILTSRYEPGLARDEEVDGVRIVRIPVLARISKGVLMPTYLGVARSILRASDAVVIQVPQFEAPILAALARLMRVPAVLTYHCDVRLPGGWFNRVADRVILVGNQLATLLARRVVAYTADYAEHSPVMRRRLGRVTIIPPPVDLAPPAPADVARFREAHGLGRATIGIAARFATEKGFEHLLDAVPRLLEEFPDLRVLHAGEFEHVIGEEGYRERLRPLLTRAGDHWVPLGVVSGAELAVFYAACDVTVLPSLNRTESFGFVQVESMLCGTPVVASALPGVRVPIATTGMGLVVPPGDAPALAAAIGTVLRAPNDFRARRRRGHGFVLAGAHCRRLRTAAGRTGPRRPGARRGPRAAVAAPARLAGLPGDDPGDGGPTRGKASSAARSRARSRHRRRAFRDRRARPSRCRRRSQRRGAVRGAPPRRVPSRRAAPTPRPCRSPTARSPRCSATASSSTSPTSRRS